MENIVNALPYDIIRRIRQNFITNDDINDGRDSVYIESNGKKYEIRVSNHWHTGEISEWLEIQFDEDGVAYVIDEYGNEERLCDYMR